VHIFRSIVTQLSVTLRDFAIARGFEVACSFFPHSSIPFYSIRLSYSPRSRQLLGPLDIEGRTTLQKLRFFHFLPFSQPSTPSPFDFHGQLSFYSPNAYCTRLEEDHLNVQELFILLPRPAQFFPSFRTVRLLRDFGIMPSYYSDPLNPKGDASFALFASISELDAISTIALI